VVKVIMQTSGSRSHPVDLWLCAHHYRVSLDALQRAGASVESSSPEPEFGWLPGRQPVAAV
jgi:hypothetical protein